MMKCVIMKDIGGADCLEVREAPMPEPKPDEALIKVHAAGICYHDLLDRSGKLHGPKAGNILGHEVSGEERLYWHGICLRDKSIDRAYRVHSAYPAVRRCYARLPQMQDDAPHCRPPGFPAIPCGRHLYVPYTVCPSSWFISPFFRNGPKPLQPFLQSGFIGCKVL